MAVDALIAALVVRSVALVLYEQQDRAGIASRFLSLVRRRDPPESVMNLGVPAVGVQFAMYAGEPGLFSRDTLPSPREAGGFRWNAQVESGGNWKLQPGGGIVVYAKAFIDGPLCHRCGNRGSIAVAKASTWLSSREVYQCQKCGHSVDYVDPDIVLRELGKDMDRFLPRAIGFRR